MAKFQVGPWKDDSQILNEPACGFLQVELSGHALKRMKERGITVADVLQVLRQPDRTDLPCEVAGRQHYRRNKTARVAIDVIWEPALGRLGVVTVTRIDRRIVRRQQP